MVETHEYKGLWWLPDNEETKLSGTLTVTKGNAELDLIGHFGLKLISDDGNELAYALELEERPRIVGISTMGKRITLERHGVASPSFHFPGIETAIYRPEVVLTGKMFADDEEVGFDEIAIHASDLNTWTRVSGFQTKIGGKEQEGTGYFISTTVDVRFEAPDAIEIPLDNGEHARIEFRAPSEGVGPGSERVSVSQTAALHLRFAKRADLNEVFERVGQLRNFLTLAVGRPVAILAVTGYQADYLREKSVERAPIEILWPVTHNPDPPARPRHPIEMLFTLPEATPNISEVMKNWFAKQADLKPVFNLFFGMRYHPSMYLDVKFLAYAQAVETYDFRRRDPHELPPARHKKRLSAIVGAAPEEWREWLRMKLASSNYLTLDQRIRDVLAACPEVRSKIVGRTDEEVDAFVTTFKQSRNYYTHYNPKLEKKAPTGAALYLLVVQLQAIIEMSLLRELGFSCDAIDEILERVRRYAEVAHFKSLAQGESA
jgi:ApeA N-terminal domain 1